ncbi:hypothetical protein LZ906_010660 [Paraclostridium ghonii]|uniref:hypothetical protein n=1 Tax=Paraclostridium ghonii TaxID=29358 RepID=UPI00202CE92C|nr:hypothetical protein [Paeniclostridium ghonii]MCM0167433.1 hypothetical protein [Paeniclostridium ghonii]
MNKKRLNIIIGVIIILILSTFILFGNDKRDQYSNEKSTKIEKNRDEYNIGEVKDLTFLKEIAGVKASNIELIDDPVGVKGEFLVPEKSILNGINYFLKDTKNEKINNVNISIDEREITAKVDYKVNEKITTPIEVRFTPNIDKDNNLVLNVREVKLLDLKLYDWIVDIVLKSFIKDWFSKDSNINVEFKNKNVLIDKDNFNGFYLENISLDSQNLKVKMIIDFNAIINKK